MTDACMLYCYWWDDVDTAPLCCAVCAHFRRQPCLDGLHKQLQQSNPLPGTVSGLLGLEADAQVFL